jgi:hypothetical protein
MRVALVTSIYGEHDHLEDPPDQTGDVEYVAVVDRPYTGTVKWRQVIEPRPQIHPRLAAKVAKCRPDLYTDADVCVWVDGSARIARADFAQWATKDLTLTTPIAQFQHPERYDIDPEAEVSTLLPKYAGLPVREQVAWYRKEGLATPSGLWATGVIATVPKAMPQGFGDAWLAEQMRWTYQDQLSLPWVFRRFGVGPVRLDGGLWDNPYISFAAHLR